MTTSHTWSRVSVDFSFSMLFFLQREVLMAMHRGQKIHHLITGHRLKHKSYKALKVVEQSVTRLPCHKFNLELSSRAMRGDTMAVRAVRSEKLDLRLSPSDMRRLEAAASASSRSVRDFVRESALARADETLADRRTFLLSKTQWAEFQAALDAPTPPLLPAQQKSADSEDRKAPVTSRR